MKKITIDGIIGFDSDNQSVRDQLKAAKGKDVLVEISSPGGFISEGLAIYNTLKNYKGRVNTHLSGSVASMATYIAMAGEKRTAENNAVFMIHNGRTIAIGDHNTMFKIGKHLDSLSNILAKEYSAKTGTSIEDIRSAMDEETFYYGEEILEAGFVHEMAGDADPEDKAEAIALAELMIDECQEKINNPESIKKDISALAVMIEASTGAKQKPQEDKNQMKEITLEVLAKDAPDLLAEIQAKAKSEGQEEAMAAGVTQERERVTAILAEEADETAKTQAIKDGLSVEASYKLFFKAEKEKKAENLENLNGSTPESVGQQGKKTGTDDGESFMAAVDAYQKDKNCTRTQALTAIATQRPELHAAYINGGGK